MVFHACELPARGRRRWALGLRAALHGWRRWAVPVARHAARRSGTACGQYLPDVGHRLVDGWGRGAFLASRRDGRYSTRRGGHVNQRPGGGPSRNCRNVNSRDFQIAQSASVLPASKLWVSPLTACRRAPTPPCTAPRQTGATVLKSRPLHLWRPDCRHVGGCRFHAAQTILLLAGNLPSLITSLATFNL